MHSWQNNHCRTQQLTVVTQYVSQIMITALMKPLQAVNIGVTELITHQQTQQEKDRTVPMPINTIQDPKNVRAWGPSTHASLLQQFSNSVLETWYKALRLKRYMEMLVHTELDDCISLEPSKVKACMRWKQGVHLET